jgi:septum formation protein
MKNLQTILLASSSPRRKHLLNQIANNLNLQVKVFQLNSKINMEKLEIPEKNETPGKYVRRVALKKATTTMKWIIENKKKLHPILTADTTVSFDNKILGKPQSKKEAFKMLKMLSNNSHKVITSVVLVHYPKKQKSSNKPNFIQITQCSTVWIGHFSNNWLKNYIDSEEPMDKSGGYGIQGKGQEIVKKINGSYSGVMGLPLFETLQMLQNLNST